MRGYDVGASMGGTGASRNVEIAAADRVDLRRNIAPQAKNLRFFDQFRRF